MLDAASVQHMEAVIAEVREKTGGEIAVVTLSDIGDRPPSEVALQIGREWGVGAKGAAGDARKNLGVVVLLVPRKNHQPGTAHLYIATGRGAEGFLTDARTGRIEDAMLPALAQEQYGAALSFGVDLIAQAFATEFGVTLTNAQDVRPPPPAGVPQIPIGWIVIGIILLIVLTRGRIFLLPLYFGGWGRGGGGWGGGRGGGGGGFGGFGGGGGFSGGGAGRSF